MKTINIHVVNSPTVLQRVIQIIKRKRINICRFIAEEENADNGIVSIQVDVDDEQLGILKRQFERLVDVIEVC